MTRTRLLQSLSAVVITLGLVPSAQAMYCGNRLVSKGDSRAKVAALCGSPVDVQSRVVHLSSSYGFNWPHHRQRQRHVNVTPSRFRMHNGAFWQQQTIPVTIEEWTYDRGTHRLMRVVTFEDGRVTHIRTLGYGFRPEPRTALPR